MLFDFTLYHKSTVIKTVVLATKKKRHKHERNRMDSPEINPCICDQLIYDKGAKIIQCGKDNLFNKWCWEN